MLDAAVDVSDGAASTGPLPTSVDLESLKALAHPLRVRILHVLTTRGPQTASSLAAALGESTGSTSYHLRQLEAKGYIAEDVDRGTARERWWRRSIDEVEVWTKELAEAPEGRAASATVLGAWTEHDSALLTAFVVGGEDRYDEPTLDAARVSSRSASLTPAQLRTLTRDVEALIRERLAEAEAAPAAEGATAHRIQIQFHAFPID